MTPIVALLRRELFERVRATSHFVMRTAYVTVLLFVVVIIIWQVLVSSIDQPLSRAPELGQILFSTFTMLQFGMVLILVPLLGAGAVVDERKERSLQLLVLTELDPWQITSGKFLARFGVISLIVLSNVPILFFTALLGGVEPLDVVRIFSLTLGTAGLLLAIGVAISAVARSTITSAMITYTILVAFLMAPIGLIWLDPSWYVHWHAPTVAVLAIAEPLQIQDNWWHSPVASLAIAGVFIALATAALRRDVRRTQIFKTGAGTAGRPVSVWSNPIAWREWARRGRPWLFWTLAAGAGVSLAILQAFVVDKHDQDDAYIGGLMITQFLALLYALAFGSGAFAQEKREQTLDLLRLTHMRSSSILFGKLAGVLRIALGFTLVVIPPLAVCVVLDRDTQWPVLLAVPVGLTVSMVFVACVSMFWSLNATTPLRAALPAVGTMLYLCLGIFMWPLLIFQDDDAIPISVAIGWLGIFGPVLFLLARAHQRDFTIGASLVAGWCTAAVLCGFAVNDAEWSLLAIHPFGLEALSFILFNEDPRRGAAWALVVGASLLIFASGIFLWASTVLLERQSALQDEGTRDNPIVALWLGLLLPGAGHIYLGELKKGLLYMGLGPLILCGLGIVNIVSAVQAYQIADDRRTVRRARAERLRRERQRFRRARENLAQDPPDPEVVPY